MQTYRIYATEISLVYTDVQAENEAGARELGMEDIMEGNGIVAKYDQENMDAYRNVSADTHYHSVKLLEI